MAIQDLYPERYAYCFGCGSRNTHGHHIRTEWDGDETVSTFTPEAWHIAVPGFVYGGVIASLVDCHSTGTAAAAMLRSEEASGTVIAGQEMPFRFVTASLQVQYLKPTPLGVALTIRGRVREWKGRKVVVESTVYAEGVATARGEVVAVQMPENFGVES